MLRTISWTLPGFPESCPGSPVPVVGLPGIPMPICACSLHATCLSIFLIAGLGLEASCWRTLKVVCLCWAWSVYLDLAHYITRLLIAPMLSCAREIHVLCLGGILVACLGVGALGCLKVVVASSWLCHFGPRPAVGLPQGFIVAF